MNYDSSNIMFQLALDMVNQSHRAIFLTGKAGTGKTTFLKYIRENCPKQMAVVAPTGVAAINAGGVTIHSFFQLPFTPFVPEAKKFSASQDEVVSRHDLISRLRIGGEKIKVLQQLELLVIDEVSMVRCDTMDAIDAVLRHIRKRPYERFGGVQVLFIGDMFQLPPVIREQEWKLLSDHYSSPYFFDSDVIKEEPPVFIEFDKIYRQNEAGFIRVLNQVRNNELDEEGIEVLEKRFKPGFPRQKDDGYIVLTTHNDRARDINTRELHQLEGLPVSYRAEIKDEFPGNAFPAEETLSLKPGAQVMFIKNDSDRSRRYFNGKIGVVTRLETDKITVQCGDEPEIEVGLETWNNIRYTMDKPSRVLQEEVLGSFNQFPLRLAWAITIHKSQGLTFEKAIIDAGQAFAAGQVYVALSRCTNLEGMILQSRIKPGALFTDERIVRFSQNCLQPSQLENELAAARKKYQEKLILEVFTVGQAVNSTATLKEYLLEHKSSFNPETFLWIDALTEKLNQLRATADKFHTWLQARFREPAVMEQNSLLQTKIKDGAGHFTREIQLILGLLEQSPAITDSRTHAKEFNESVKEVFAELSARLFLLKDFNGITDIESWHRKKNSFVLPTLRVNAYAASSEQKVQSPHPALYQQLRKLRDSICSKKDLPVYLVAGSKALDEMAAFLPQSPEELQEISGFGKTRAESYGKQFLEIIQQYSMERGLSSRIGDKESKKKKKTNSKPKTDTRPRTDTKAESFRLFREGLSVADIAKTRNFTAQTIEGHLAHYVRQGDIAIEELLSPDKIILLEPAIRSMQGGSIIPIKDQLGDVVSFGDIRLVIASEAFKKDGKPES